MRRKGHLTFQHLIQTEKEKILNNSHELDKIYDKLDSRLSITPSKHSRA